MATQGKHVNNPKDPRGLGENDEEIYDDSLCYACKQDLNQDVDNVVCSVCHSYSHLKCVDLKMHPRFASLLSTKALEYRISKDQSQRAIVEKITVTQVGKLALFKYICPRCRQALSRTKQYEEACSRTLFNNLADNFGQKERPQQKQIRIKQECLLDTKKNTAESSASHSSRQEAATSGDQKTLNHKGGAAQTHKIHPATAPSRGPNKQRPRHPILQRKLSNHDSASVSSTESSFSDSDEFVLSNAASESEDDSFSGSSSSSLPSGEEDDSHKAHTEVSSDNFIVASPINSKGKGKGKTKPKTGSKAQAQARARARARADGGLKAGANPGSKGRSRKGAKVTSENADEQVKMQMEQVKMQIQIL